jgi:hypothetical protein
MTLSTRVALCGSHGVSTIPLTNPPPEHRTIFSRASTELQATKASRRWQPPRVTSTTGLQFKHLVPLDATSRCNRIRITHSQLDHTLASISELEGSQADLHKPPRREGAHLAVHGWPRHLFITPTPDRVVGPFTGHSACRPNAYDRSLAASCPSSNLLVIGTQRPALTRDRTHR